MKRLVILLMAVLPLVAMAQRVDKPGEPYEFFCHVYFCSLPNRTSLEWDGEKKSKKLYDENGTKIEFCNSSSVINYMCKRGWALFSIHQTTNDPAAEVMYFKKTVTSDEQAKEGLIFREDSKK